MVVPDALSIRCVRSDDWGMVSSIWMVVRAAAVWLGLCSSVPWSSTTQSSSTSSVSVELSIRWLSFSFGGSAHAGSTEMPPQRSSQGFATRWNKADLLGVGGTSEGLTVLPPRRTELSTIQAGLLTPGVEKSSRLPRMNPVANATTITSYSGGGRVGFSPTSRFIPLSGTPR